MNLRTVIFLVVTTYWTSAMSAVAAEANYRKARGAIIEAVRAAKTNQIGAEVANVLLDYVEKNSGLTAETANDFLPDAPPGKE